MEEVRLHLTCKFRCSLKITCQSIDVLRAGTTDASILMLSAPTVGYQEGVQVSKSAQGARNYANFYFLTPKLISHDRD